MRVHSQAEASKEARQFCCETAMSSADGDDAAVLGSSNNLSVDNVWEYIVRFIDHGAWFIDSRNCECNLK